MATAREVRLRIRSVNNIAQVTRGPGHPLLADRPELRRRLVVLITSDRGLAGAYNTNVIRFALEQSRQVEVPTSYVTVGRKGRDILLRRREDIRAECSALPAPPPAADASAIGQLG